jgi:DNA-binding NtrC family response regulator
MRTSTDEATVKAEERSAAPLGEGLWLRVFLPTGSTLHRLPAAGALVIGRGDTADIVIPDASVSRRHATIAIGPPLVLEDLASQNGTRHGEKKLAAGEKRVFAPGDILELGVVLAVVQAIEASSFAERVSDHRALRAQLASACAAAASQPFALACVVAEDRASIGVVANYLTRRLREPDLIAQPDPMTFELMLRAMSSSDATALVQQARQHLEEAGMKVRVGVACWPQDGRDADALQAAARPGREPVARGRQEMTVRGATDSMERLRRFTDRVAPSSINVLLLGETGVGKERLAETIHHRSGRAHMPFVRINCAALTESLLESELFGHEKGAFTGATQTKAGLLETADGGTVFLDEIGETSQGLQAKLLRAIEQREIMRVGGRHPVRVDVRFVSATNRDLKSEVANERFRRDLYFRLAGISLQIPPLRERPWEIAELARLFLAEICGGLGRLPPALSDQVLDYMRHHDWPGNIRELRNVVHHAVLLCDGDRILPEHLPLELLETNSSAAPSVEQPRNVLTLDRGQIIDALSRCGWNQTEAAQVLHVSRRTLVYRLKALDIHRPGSKAAVDSLALKRK